MENKASQLIEDGQESNSAIKVVAEVLAKNTKKPRFLQHVGIQHVHARSSDSNCQAESAVEKRGNVELQVCVDTLTKQLKESEETRLKQDEEYRKRDEWNRKKQDAIDAKLDFLLSQLQAR
uniref:Uncharacterized protein n=1 Tax=Hordeum vulgare subsp. vulgare TaxID=112509 RepID=A0A8I7B9C5_HORVV